MSKNKMVGICKVGEKGQIVIPKEVRDMFNICSGDTILVLADIEKGIAIVKPDVVENLTEQLLNK